MKRWLLLLPLSLATAGSAVAQLVDFRPGYRLSPTGDTVRGFVNDCGARRNALSCQFRATRTAATEAFGPAELAGYGFTDAPSKHYLSLVLPTPLRTGVPPMRRVPAPPGPGPRLFADAVVRGPASLYFLDDDDLHPHYYLQMGAAGPLQELRVETRRADDDGGRRFLKTINHYQQTLIVAFGDCPAVQPAITTTAFTLPALTLVVARYNQCRAAAAGGAAVLALPEQQSWRVQTDLVAGARVVGSLVVRTGNGSSAYDTRIRQALAPQAGVQVLFTNSRFSRSLVLGLGAQLDWQRFELTAGGPRRAARVNYVYEALALRLPLLVRLVRPQGTVRPFAEIGVTAALAYELQNRSAFAFGPALEEPWFGSTYLVQHSTFVGAGLSVARGGHARWGAGLRYESGNGPGLQVDLRGFQVLFTYGLGK